jgi:selenide, water dikinase
MSSEESVQEVRLTQYSHGAGCGCKIAPAVLDRILKGNHSVAFPGLLVGNSTRDDAAVLDLGNGEALISTTDFFMPVVDDARDFGRIASANAISDVYAMGGRPLLAVAILGWPVDKLSPELAARVLEGSRAVCAEAGIPLAGGHSIDSPEPIFGLAVSGKVSLPHLKKNSTAREGDLLFLTKPIGTGILGTASKRSLLRKEDYEPWVASMCLLNKAGEELGKCGAVTALTDVTGFGLLGHLIEMAEGSGLSAVIDYKAVPLLQGVEFYTSQFCFPDNTYRNWNSYESKVSGIQGTSFITLCDPQTSGGLLVAVDPYCADEYYRIASQLNLPDFALKPVGRMVAAGSCTVEVKE